MQSHYNLEAYQAYSGYSYSTEGVLALYFDTIRAAVGDLLMIWLKAIDSYSCLEGFLVITFISYCTISTTIVTMAYITKAFGTDSHLKES